MNFQKTDVWSDPGTFLGDPATVRSVLRNQDFVITDFAPYLEHIQQRLGQPLSNVVDLIHSSFLFDNGEVHLNGRRRVAPCFSPRFVEGWRPRIRKAVEDALDNLAASANPDLMSGFVEDAFLSVASSVFGVASSERQKLAGSIRQLNSLVTPMLPIATLIKIDEAIGHLINVLMEDESVVDPSGIPTVFQALKEQPGMTKREAVNLTLTTLVASHTMAQGVAFSIYALLIDTPDKWKALAANECTSDWLDELLSRFTSTQTLIRAASKDTKFQGCPHAQGEAVVMSMPSINKALRQQRDQKGDGAWHMSFGFGPHKCLGAPLSEVFFEEVLPALARRFPDLILHRHKVNFHVSMLVQYPKQLPCELAPSNKRINSRMVEISEMSAARAIVNDDENWSPPTMEAHLSVLQDRSGKDLTQALNIARNAMFFMSGPRHAALRSEVMDCLGGNRLVAWQPMIDDVVSTVLDELEAQKKPDLIGDFADPIFRRVAKTILGLESGDPQQFDTLAPILQDVLEPWLPMRELERLQGIFATLIADMKDPVPNPSLPSDPLLAALIKAELPGTSRDDLKSLVLILYGASFNLSHTLGNVLHQLLTLHADSTDMALSLAEDNVRLEEFISLCASPRYIYRMARKPLNFEGFEMGAGHTLRLNLQAINRGVSSGNLAFGHGLHRCVGAALSKRLLRTAVPALFKRFPKLHLHAQQQTYFDMTQTVALSRLPCRLG